MPVAATITPEFVLQVETAERLAWGGLYEAATSETVRLAGIQRVQIGLATAGIAAHVDVLAFNRVIGLGLGETATPEQIDTIIAAYKDAGVPRFFIQLAPHASPATIPDWLTERGFVHYNNWIRLVRGVEKLPVAPSDVRVEEIGSDQGATFAQLIVTAFEWPTVAESMIAATVGRPNWHFYLAFVGDQPIATAGMYIHNQTAWIDFASTLAEFRGHGAQTALIARRITDAAKRGCRWLTVETAEDRPDKPSISNRNIRRCGFTQTYVRPNYLWKMNSD